jgi:hypothetical protein
LEGRGGVQGARFWRGEGRVKRFVKRLFFLAPQAILGGGKVGILVLDFQFSTAHSEFFVLVFPVFV